MTPAFGNVFTEIAALLMIAAVVGAIGLRLRQPLIVSFLAVGMLVGPSILGWVSADDQVDLLAELGIALLLFVVGLKLDLHIIRAMGPVALATGLGQVFFTAAIGYLLALAMGMSAVTAIYVAVALTFSSTIIIVKLLSDKREIDTLHGRIAIGLLIVQDILVVLVMIGLTALGPAAETTTLGLTALMVLIKGAVFVAAIGLLMRFALTPILNQLARSSELLLLSAIAWAVALGAAGMYFGFSKEVGAFLAGVSLASTPYRETIGARLVSLRDFLLLFFFIDLGAGLDLSTLGGQIGPALVLSLFVLIGNPLIVMIIMGVMGYRKRTAFLTGLTVAQISEFSLILGALGLSLGHIDNDTLGLITLVGLVTISASTYLILYSHPLFERIAPWLNIFERRQPRSEPHQNKLEDRPYEVIVFGLGRFGARIMQVLRQRGLSVLGVDNDPDLVRRLKKDRNAVQYGDAESSEFLATLPHINARWIISSIPEKATNLVLLNGLRGQGYGGRIGLTAYSDAIAARLDQAGADYILVPYAEAAENVVDHLFGGVGKQVIVAEENGSEEQAS